jgi:hypothetical protein
MFQHCEAAHRPGWQAIISRGGLRGILIRGLSGCWPQQANGGARWGARLCCQDRDQGHLTGNDELATRNQSAVGMTRHSLGRQRLRSSLAGWREHGVARQGSVAAAARTTLAS